MRKHILAAGFLVAAVVAVPALADSKIAFVDEQEAMLDTDFAKKAIESFNSQIKPQRDRAAAIQKDIEGIEAKAQKDQAVMSDADKKNLAKQEQGKIAEYQALAQSVQKANQDANNDLLQHLGPKLKPALEELRTQGGYQAILDRRTAASIDPALDLTKKLTEKLNAAK